MNSGATPRVSIVTPVYNGAKHLSTCIESVLGQTHSNFEYLIINNCSTDSTLDIAKKYASRDSRIRIHTNSELLNVVDSHNKAFALAPPENDYIKIVGADDWLFPDCLTEMINVAEEYPSIAMVTSYVLVGSRIGWVGLPYPSTFVKGQDICRMRLLNGVRVFGGPSASLLRTSAVKEQQPFYTVGNYHGDNEAYLKILRNHDFGFVHQVLSFNRHGEDSRTTHYLQSFNSQTLAITEELVRFGPIYLTESELKVRLAEATHDYYAFLGASVFHHRGTKFWQTHRERRDKLGMPIDYAKLSGFVVGRLLDLLLNPKRTIEGAYRRVFPPNTKAGQFPD